MNPEQLPSATTLIGEDRAQEGAENLGGKSRVPGTSIAQRIGQGQDPLADGYLRKNAVDEMGGCIRHSPPSTRRTEPSTLAREGDETVVAASIAVDAKKAVRKHAALDVGAELSLDEMCHRGAVPPRSPDRTNCLQVWTS